MQENRDTNNEQHYVAAIDVGTTKIVAIVGSVDSQQRVSVKGVSVVKSDGVVDGQVVNIRKAEESIKRAITEAEKRSGVNIEEVYVGIAGRNIRSTQASFEEFFDSVNHVVTEEDVEKLRKKASRLGVGPDEKILHIIPTFFYIDGNITTEPIGMFGQKMVADFKIIVGNKNSVDIIKQTINDLGIKVKGIILEPIASAEAVLTKEEIDLGVTLVDIGGGTSDMIILKDNVLRHTKVIPAGGNIITEDIKRELKILKEHAEKLKIKHGKVVYPKGTKNYIITIPIVNQEAREISMFLLSDIIRARVNDIVRTINMQIETSGLRDELGAGLVLTGGGSMLSGLVHYFSLKTGLKTRIATPARSLTGNSELNHPMYATAIGLIKVGYKMQNDFDDDEQHNIMKGSSGLLKKFFKNLNTLISGDSDKDI